MRYCHWSDCSNVVTAGGGFAGEGARAAGVAGAFFGILLAASSVMWALYKFKPGLLGGGGRAAAASPEGVNLLQISQPRATTNYNVVKAAGAGGGSGWGYGPVKVFSRLNA